MSRTRLRGRHLRRSASVLALCGALLAILVAPAQAAPGDHDETFSANGKTTTDFGGRDGAAGVVRQPDGKLVACL